MLQARTAPFPGYDGRSQSLWFVPLAGVRHPFPSRTRPLRPPAAMIVRSRARESSAARTFFSTQTPLRSMPQGGFVLKIENREKNVECSAWPLCSGRPLSAAECRAGRVQGKDSHRDARQNCRAGAPTRAIHALPSKFFSLFPTLEAHCIVTTHYFLLPPPSSLPTGGSSSLGYSLPARRRTI